MARKHHKPEEIGAPLRQVEVLVGQGKPVTDAVWAIGVTEATYYRWRSEFGGLKLDQVKRLKALEQETSHLRQAMGNRGRSPGDQAVVAVWRTRSGSGGIVIACGTCRRSPR